MGNFQGHLLPGIIFVFYGLVWILLSYWLHLTTPSAKKTRAAAASVPGGVGSGSYSDFKREIRLGRLSYIPQPFCAKIPLEPLLKIVLSIIGIVVEAFMDLNEDKKLVFKVVRVYHPDGTLGSVSKVHHITMYCGFLISGIVDLFGLLVRIPRNASKIFFSLAFFVESLLFWFHVHDRDHLEIAVHSLLIIAIVASVLLSLTRVIQPANVLINSFLGMTILLQGTWFINIGSILYGGSPTWNRDEEDVSNKQIMFAVVIFNWHIIGNALFALVLYMLMLAIVKGSVKYRRHHRRGADGMSKLSWPSFPQKTNEISNEEKINLMEGENDTVL